MESSAGGLSNALISAVVVLLLAAGPSFAQSLPNYDTNTYCKSAAGGGPQPGTCVSAEGTRRDAAASP